MFRRCLPLPLPLLPLLLLLLLLSPAPAHAAAEAAAGGVHFCPLNTPACQSVVEPGSRAPLQDFDASAVGAVLGAAQGLWVPAAAGHVELVRGGWVLGVGSLDSPLSSLDAALRIHALPSDARFALVNSLDSVGRSVASILRLDEDNATLSMLLREDKATPFVTRPFADARSPARLLFASPQYGDEDFWQSELLSAVALGGPVGLQGSVQTELSGVADSPKRPYAWDEYYGCTANIALGMSWYHDGTYYVSDRSCVVWNVTLSAGSGRPTAVFLRGGQCSADVSDMGAFPRLADVVPVGGGGGGFAVKSSAGIFRLNATLGDVRQLARDAPLAAVPSLKQCGWVAGGEGGVTLPMHATGPLGYSQLDSRLYTTLRFEGAPQINNQRTLLLALQESPPSPSPPPLHRPTLDSSLFNVQRFVLTTAGLGARAFRDLPGFSGNPTLPEHLFPGRPSTLSACFDASPQHSQQFVLGFSGPVGAERCDLSAGAVVYSSDDQVEYMLGEGEVGTQFASVDLRHNNNHFLAVNQQTATSARVQEWGNLTRWWDFQLNDLGWITGIQTSDGLVNVSYGYSGLGPDSGEREVTMYAFDHVSLTQETLVLSSDAEGRIERVDNAFGETVAEFLPSGGAALERLRLGATTYVAVDPTYMTKDGDENVGFVVAGAGDAPELCYWSV